MDKENDDRREREGGRWEIAGILRLSLSLPPSSDRYPLFRIFVQKRMKGEEICYLFSFPSEKGLGYLTIDTLKGILLELEPNLVRFRQSDFEPIFRDISLCPCRAIPS